MYDWEPENYGFCQFNKTPNYELAAALEVLRRSVCAYGGLSAACDCKYGLGDYVNGRPRHAGSEITGCPELRELIHRLLYRPETLGGDVTQEARVVKAYKDGRKSIVDAMVQMTNRDDSDYTVNRYTG